MQLGMHLRELWRHRLGLVAALVFALLAALWSGNRISVLPPKLKPRPHQIASAKTQVLVDTPNSTVTNLSAYTYDFQSLTNRAALLGNLMASEPVRLYIARRAGIPSDLIEAIAPVTEQVPRALLEPDSQKRASDILRATDNYRLDIEADPAVPILNIYTQGPDEGAARRLADSAVAGLRDYLNALANVQGVRASQRIRLIQLGPASGGVINGGVALQIYVLTFVVAFALAAWGVLALARVRRGWRQASPSTEQGAGEASVERDDASAMDVPPAPANRIRRGHRREAA